MVSPVIVLKPPTGPADGAREETEKMKVYISESVYRDLIEAGERHLAWQNWGVDNQLALKIAREAEKKGLSHGQMCERLCGVLRAAISSAKLER